VANAVEAVQILMIASIGIQAYSVVQLSHSIRWDRCAPFIVGGAAALPIGILLLVNLQPRTYASAIGAALVAYGLYMLLRRQVSIKSGYRPATDALVGALGGITGPLAAFPGACVTIWCGMRGWDKNRQRAVYQPFILIMQLLTLLALEVSGAGQSYDISLMEYAPAALLGAYCGLYIFKRLNDRHFNIAIYVLLIISGIALVAK